MNRRSFESQRTGSGRLGMLIGGAMLLALIGFAVWAMLFLRRVDPGKVGVMVDYCAGSAGQANFSPVETGSFVTVSPCKQLAEYTIAAQQLVMVRLIEEGTVSGDDSVACRDAKGVPVWVDSTTIWRVDPSKAGQIYQRWPGKSIEELQFDVVRAQVRSAITDACAFFRYDEIFGPKRIELGMKVTEFLSERLPQSSLLLESFLMRDVYLTEENEQAIQQKSIKEQEAIAAQFEQQKAEYEANAAIATAEGEKQVAILQAQGQAEAIRVVMEQLGGGTDYYIKYIYIQQWNGVVPYVLVTGDGKEIPLITELPANLLPLPEGGVPTPTSEAGGQ